MSRIPKVETERTSKSIKAKLAFYGISTVFCFVAALASNDGWRGIFFIASFLSLLGYIGARIMRWWEHD